MEIWWTATVSVEDTSVPGFGVGVVVTPPTNVGQLRPLQFRTLYITGKCPILLHLLHRFSAAGKFLFPGGC